MTQTTPTVEKLISVFSVDLRRAYKNVEGYEVKEITESFVTAINQKLLAVRLDEVRKARQVALMHSMDKGEAIYAVLDKRVFQLTTELNKEGGSDGRV